MTKNPIIQIGDRKVGSGQPTYIAGEIGINHNGDLDIACRLIDMAADAGCDAVKFQKRTPELCVPPEQKSLVRETPWGEMTYLDYRYKVEFSEKEYARIDECCRARDVQWTASCWDVPSLEFLERFDPPFHKIASAKLTDTALLKATRATGKPVILSTGMSTAEQIRTAVDLLGRDNLLLSHTTSSYPCPSEEINLRMIQTLAQMFGVPVGYSGHERGLQVTLAAVAMGACFIERHITLDRTMWGSDQAASVEPQGLQRLVRDIRVIEQAMGDGVKQVYESEKAVMKKLRWQDAD